MTSETLILQTDVRLYLSFHYFFHLFIFVGSESCLYRAGDSDDGLAGKDAEATRGFPGWYRGQRGRGHPGKIIKKIFYLLVVQV